jgi:phosphohistidine phosphatase
MHDEDVTQRTTTLYLLRHAIAVPRDNSADAPDSQRPLTPKGERRMRLAAQGMSALGLSFEGIVSSPYLRAKQTADIVAEVLQTPVQVDLSPALAPEGNPCQLIAELKRRDRARQPLLLVGHEPYLSHLISILLTGGPTLEVVMKKGGLCKLRADRWRYGRCAILEWLLTPRQLRRLG